MKSSLLRNARIFTPPDQGGCLAGREQGRLLHWDRGALLCRGGLIERVGKEQEVLKGLSAPEVDGELDCQGKALIPGLVDPHTHACFAATREAEFNLRLAGTSYLEILKQGGGILSSVRAVAAASQEELLASTVGHLEAALAQGTTTMEVKSGYGLDLANELKMLQVIEQAGQQTPLEVVATFMGAHAVPEEFRGNPGSYVDLVIEEMLPAVAEQRLARFCDVFCEEGVFSIAETRRILRAAQGHGMGAKIHADEVHDLGGAALAAELGAVSAEHLLAASDQGLKQMAAAGAIAVLLPGTAFSLKKPYARARQMIDLGLPVALASDLNPGSCYIESMPLIFALAVLTMDLTPPEALTAATLNAAHALCLGDRLGSLTPGKQADFLLLDGEGPAVMAYHPGGQVVSAVYKKGERVR